MKYMNTNNFKYEILNIKTIRFALLQLYIFFNGFVSFEPAIADYIFILLLITYFIDYKKNTIYII